MRKFSFYFDAEILTIFQLRGGSVGKFLPWREFKLIGQIFHETLTSMQFGLEGIYHNNMIFLWAMSLDCLGGWYFPGGSVLSALGGSLHQFFARGYQKEKMH